MSIVRKDDGNVVRQFVAQSETVKQADNGMQGTAIISGLGVAAPVLSTFAGAGWQVVAIITGEGLIVLAVYGVYSLFKVRAERIKMSEAGIA